MSTDLLFGFVDKYHLCLGVDPARDVYTVQELDTALNYHLLKVCASIIINTEGDQNSDRIDLDSVINSLPTEPIELYSGKLSFTFTISSNNFPVKLVYSALQHLQSQEIDEIVRPFPKRSRKVSTGDNWIWSGYSLDDEINSVKSILLKSIDEYSEFVAGNGLSFPDSYFLNPKYSIVYEYKPASVSIPASAPKLNTYYLLDENRELPKVTVLINRDGKSEVNSSESSKIKFSGSQFTVATHFQSAANSFFHSTPVVVFIYQMLREDLNKHYNLNDPFISY